MSRFQPYQHYIYRRVQYFQWALLALAFAGELLNWKLLPRDPSAPNILVSLILLSIFGLLSFCTPLEGTFWDRLCFIFMETIVLTGATAAGVARFVFPLYTVVMAKGCLILDRRGLWITGAVAFVGQILWCSYKIAITSPGVWRHGWTPAAVFAIAGSAVILTYVGIAVMILVGMLTLSLVSEHKNRMETERLSKEVEVLATEVERSRIAREIHDSLGHSLTTLNVQLDLARRLAKDDPVRSEQALNLAKGLATQSLDDVRLAVKSIRKPNFNWREAVEALVKEATANHPIAVRLASPLPELPAAIGFQIYRVIQECLTNVLKHAHATEVSISVSCQSSAAELDFSDNGCGMQSASDGGFGIKGMQERVESVRGSIIIDSNEDGGTRIKVSIPL